MPRILLLDDSQEVLDTLTPLLTSQGHDVVPVKDGNEALVLLQSVEEFDLLATDLRMSPVHGIQVIKIARVIRPTMDIVVISAYLDPAMIQQILALGCAGYVRKPYDVEAILKPIREVLERRQRLGIRPSVGGSGDMIV